MDVEQTNILCCCLCQTSCSNNPHHCSSSLQSWDKTQGFVFNPPWSLQSCRNRIWIGMLYLASGAAQTQQPSQATTAANTTFVESPSPHCTALPGRACCCPAWLPSKWERAAWLKSCLCQALICCRVCRALYASTRLRCNESSINYCANNAPLIWMLSVLWEQQPSKALLSTSFHPQTTGQALWKSEFACGENCSICDKSSLAGADTHSPTVPSPHALIAHRKGMIEGSMLGNTGNHSSNPLWSLSVMPHNLDISHSVCSLQTRYAG